MAFFKFKKPKDIEIKLKSYLHHIDYDQNPLEKIKKFNSRKKTVYNLKVDKRVKKFDSQNDLKNLI